MFDLRYSPSQFDDPDHHLAVAAAGYEILYDGRVGVVHKLNNGLARSYAALSNQQGNAAKMYGKWGSDVFEVLEKSLDLSREGRYLPDDGDTSSAFLDAPEPGSFPRRNAPAPRQAHEIAALIAQEFSRPAFLEEINRLAADHVKLAAMVFFARLSIP
jgi:hypothetical protein